MRKNLVIALLLFSIGFLLVGCGSSPSWMVNLTPTGTYQPDQPIEFQLTVTQEEKGISGLQATAMLEMKNMDHGSIDLVFEDQGEGHYTASGILPMSGEWEAFIQVSDGKNKKEFVSQITIKE